MIYQKLSDGTIDWCAMCKRRSSDSYDLCCMCNYVTEDDPPSHYEPIAKPITNADRIRSMSDEELADWLGVYCNGQTAQEAGKPCNSGMGSCEECWLDWLRQETRDV